MRPMPRRSSDDDAVAVVVEEPTILIRIAQLWDPGMSDDELYDATRGHWKVGKRRDTVALAMAVATGIVREVYVIDRWHRAGTTSSATSIHASAPADRWEFTGRVADEEIRSKYVGRSVRDYFAKGNRSPFRYVGGVR